VVAVVVVLMTTLKIMNRRVKNIYYIIRLNTNNPIQNEYKRMIIERYKEIQFLALPYVVQELCQVDTI